jgi:hypothetical protein
MEKIHYAKEIPIQRLWEEDKKMFLSLPDQPFEVCRYVTARTNACAKITLHKGLHTYSVAPKYANSQVLVKLTHEEVILLDEDYQEIGRHRRLYGDHKQESMNWIPYLSQLAKRPNALKYTGIYSMLPDPVKQYIDRSKKQDRSALLKALAYMNQESGFDAACQVLTQAINQDVCDYDSILLVYRHRCQTLPEMKLTGSYDVPMESQVSFNAGVYDEIFHQIASDETVINQKEGQEGKAKPIETETPGQTRIRSGKKQVVHA